MTRDKPDMQRALVLQGRGALGAYEVGVIKELCKMIRHNKRIVILGAGYGRIFLATNAA